MPFTALPDPFRCTKNRYAGYFQPAPGIGFLCVLSPRFHQGLFTVKPSGLMHIHACFQCSDSIAALFCSLCRGIHFTAAATVLHTAAEHFLFFIGHVLPFAEHLLLPHHTAHSPATEAAEQYLTKQYDTGSLPERYDTNMQYRRQNIVPQQPYDTGYHEYSGGNDRNNKGYFFHPFPFHKIIFIKGILATNDS